MRCGISPREFEDLTPRELWLIAEEYNNARQQQREEMITQAYLIAAWSRAKRLPKLRRVLEESRPKPQISQTPEQMLTFVKAMHAELTKGG